MDPDANFRERIEILKSDRYLAGTAELDRFIKLTDAYAEWRANGGFVASRKLRDELLTLHQR